MSATGFDPSQYLVKLKGKDYLEVKWRLVWMRELHPDATITTEVIEHDANNRWAMFRAYVSIPGGGASSGHGSESAADFGDYIEKAETKAIGRALGALGFGTQFSAQEFGGEHESDRPVDAPLPARARTTSVNTIPLGESRTLTAQAADNPNGNGITDKQIGLIRLLAEQKCVEPETVRSMHGRESARSLTKAEASTLIDQLQAL